MQKGSGEADGEHQSAETICHVFPKTQNLGLIGNFIFQTEHWSGGGRKGAVVFRRFYNAINGREGVLGKDCP